MDSGFDTILSVSPAVVEALANEMASGLDLLRRIDDNAYANGSSSSGSVGAHFRHNLNFVEAVIDGVLIGRIDYAKRVRDRRIEADRTFAAERFTETILRLKRIGYGDAGKEVSVVSEVEPRVVYRSSIGRELEFALSHTVHHHALIAEKLRALGVCVEASFGVAPSTARFWETSQTRTETNT